MALRCFVDELSDPSALKPILPQLMDSIFKLMSEVSTVRQTKNTSSACRVVAVEKHNDMLHRKESVPRMGAPLREARALAAPLDLSFGIGARAELLQGRRVASMLVQYGVALTMVCVSRDC
jgi:hypothetical protein